MTALCDTAALAFCDMAKFDAVWGKVPASKLAFFRAAEATIVAANGVYTRPFDDRERTDAEETYWTAGYADRLIASVESACEVWKMAEQTYVAAVERISKWFASLGWTHLSRSLARTLDYADMAHNSAVELRNAAKADRLAQGQQNGRGRAAR